MLFLPFYYTNFYISYGETPTEVAVKEFTFFSTGSEGKSVILRNEGLNTAAFHLKINNWSVTTSVGMVKYITNMMAEFVGEPLYRKVWRFVRDARYHFDPLSADTWIHSPSSLLNSIGFGYCDDAATITYALWKALNYEARVIGLTGHVVPEIKINDRWEMYDPDLQVYYYIANGSVAGVTDLENNASLITDPINPVLTPDHPLFEEVYSADLAMIYTSKNDNSVGDWYINTLPNDPNIEFQIPPGGDLSFPNNGVFTLNTTYGSLAQVNSTAKITIPKGWTGKIKVPLVIQTIRGNSTVQICGQQFSYEQELQEFLNQRIDFIPEIYFVDTVVSMEVIYLLNPLVIGWNESNTINIIGLNLEGISFSFLN